MRYAIIIEKGKRNYWAYVPDVPGCVTVGDTFQEVKKLMKDALEFHFEGMLLDGEIVPQPATGCSYVNINLNRVAKAVRNQIQNA